MPAMGHASSLESGGRREGNGTCDSDAFAWFLERDASPLSEEFPEGSKISFLGVWGDCCDRTQFVSVFLLQMPHLQNPHHHFAAPPPKLDGVHNAPPAPGRGYLHRGGRLYTRMLWGSIANP